jgi:hypothetical protein
MQKQNEDMVEEAEVIEQSFTTQGGSSEELVLESRIKQYLGDIERLKARVTEKKMMFESAFENDAVYLKHQESVKEAKKILQKTRSEMMKIPAIAQLQSDLKALKDEMKDLQDGLNITLQQFRDTTGQTSITRDDGEVYEIVTMVKLKKKV